MARSALAPQQINRSGITPAYTTPNAAGHSVVNDGRTFLHVKTGGTGLTVTAETPGTVDGQAVADRAYVIGTNTELMIGPFPPSDYDQPDGSGINFDFSATTSVTIAALRL